jgi:hypothetical protein
MLQNCKLQHKRVEAVNMTTSMTRTNQFHAAVILVTLRVAHLINDLLARIEPEVSSHFSQQPPTGT